MQEMSQCLTEDAVPPLERVQLLRILPQPRQEAGDPQIGPACLCCAPCALLIVSVTWPACWVRRAIAESNRGRLVIASR